ncbi:MAG: hypothetical protein JW900_10895 [Anaerolineae bacterium]|nr:hypothetical protein [Anaerolineae bacterium]
MNEGLAPYGWSGRLADSAQRHADDLALHGLSSHIGSDGSTKEQRVADALYFAWGDGAFVGENYWVGGGSVQDAFGWFMNDPAHRENILSEQFREVGIAAAVGADGQNYYVLDFGARPNVLPIFVNDGAESTASIRVAIRLTNEEAYPQGEGTIYMGQALDVRISNTPDVEGRPWQTWEPLIDWTLPDEPGEHTVYVQFRDGAGRMSPLSTDTIRLLPGEGTPMPPTATMIPVASPTVTPSPVSLAPTATATWSTPSPPSATETAPQPTPPPGRPSLTPVPIAAVTATPFPTWTPLTGLSVIDKPARPVTPLPLLYALGAVAVLLGISLALRRGN